VPETHRTHETIETMQLMITMLVTFAALVLGLLIASVKNSYDNAGRDRQGYALQLTQLDRCLRDYGAVVDSMRDLLKKRHSCRHCQYVAQRVETRGGAISRHLAHAASRRGPGAGRGHGRGRRATETGLSDHGTAPRISRRRMVRSPRFDTAPSFCTRLAYQASRKRTFSATCARQLSARSCCLVVRLLSLRARPRSGYKRI
jgi:hypothetical protein